MTLHAGAGKSTAAHIVSHVASICSLRNMLLLEAAFAGDLLGIALVVRSSTGDPVLESFILSDGSASVLLHARGSSSTGSHWQASTSLTTSCATLNIVRSLRHTDSWARLELLDWLPISKAHRCLVLVQGLLVCTTVGTLLAALLLLLIQVSILELQSACRATIDSLASTRSQWLLNLVLLIHLTSWGAHTAAHLILGVMHRLSWLLFLIELLLVSG